MFYYFSTVEEDLLALNGTRLLVTGFKPDIGDYVTIGKSSYLVLGVEHTFETNGKYTGTKVHVKEKLPIDWKKNLTR